MRKNIFKTFFTASAVSFAAVVFLVACNVKPGISESVPTQTVTEREAILKAFKPWRALGSIAIDSVEDGKFNASFAWDVNKQGFEIKLFGPLGVQLVQLQQDKKGARITDRNGTLEGQNAEALLADVLGTQVPINQMQNWAVGLPGDAMPVNVESGKVVLGKVDKLQRDAIGRLDSMVVTGRDNTSWNVDFKRYLVLEDMYLPKTVVVESDDVTINLSFKKWSRGEKADSGRLSIPGVGS